MRLNHAARKGISYEKAFATKLRNGLAGPEVRVFADQWFSINDVLGQRFLCVDVGVVTENSVLVCECKLTFQPEVAWYQLEKRYAPVLRHIFNKPVSTLQVCKFLTPDALGIERRTPEQLLAKPEPGRYLYHWLGR